jgi:cysteine desulfurase
MIYLDNAASTQVDPEVAELMTTVMLNFYGNPSSSHDAGLEARAIIEESRNTISQILGCNSQQIIFTSGGTEAINLTFFNIAQHSHIKHIITSPLEHPAVLHSIDRYGLSEKTEFVDILQDATPDIIQLEKMLQQMPGAFVSLMHVHNESGSMADPLKVSELCNKYGALYFCDTVQSIGKTMVHFSGMEFDYAACSAHKFHGPRGIGFLFVKEPMKLKAQTVGGGQETGLRSGTENTASIAGMCKAIEISHQGMDIYNERITTLKHRLIDTLEEQIPSIPIVARDNSIPHILTLGIPDKAENSTIAQQLNEAGFAVSTGSACHATSKQSTLFTHIGLSGYYPLRVSLSRFTTTKEVDEFASHLVRMYCI